MEKLNVLEKALLELLEYKYLIHIHNNIEFYNIIDNGIAVGWMNADAIRIQYLQEVYL